MSNWKKTFALNITLMALSMTLFSCSAKEDPAIGHWLGTITDENGRETWGTLLVEPDNAGSYRVGLTYLTIGAFNTDCVDSSMGGSSIMFHYKKSKFDLVFEGTISEDGRTMSGTMTASAESESESAGGTFTFEKTPRPGDLPTLMTFWGEIDTETGITDISILLAVTPDGRYVGEYNEPEHNLNHMPFYNVSHADGVIQASISTFGPPMIFELTLSEDKSSLTGVLTGRSGETPFEMIRAD